MINRINYNIDVGDAPPSSRNRIILAEDGVDFSTIYNRLQDMRSTVTNKTTSPVPMQGLSTLKPTQVGETTSSFSTVYAPGVIGVYVQRSVELDDPSTTLQKAQELQKDIQEKGLSGFFDGMDSKESFAYLFEEYADTFGVGFLDEEWNMWALNRPLNDSDYAKIEVANSFDLSMRRVLLNNFDFAWNRQNPDSGKNIHNEYVEAFADYFGYGDMTPEERYQAILTDYKRSGDFSYAATHKMLWLLEKTGAADPQFVLDAQFMLKHKRECEYAALDMTVTDMAMSRFANVFYSYDADAEILRIVDYILETRKEFQATSPHLTDFGRYSDPELYQFFEKLAADIGALGDVMGGML